MNDLVARLRAQPTERTYDSVGRAYDFPKHLIEEAASCISQQDAELERLRREVANRRPEDAAAVLFLQKMTELVPIRDVVKATATIGTLIEYFKGCVDHRREELAEARKATFIEAAEIAESAKEMRERLFAENGASLNASKAVQAEEIAAALRAKAEETPHG